MKTEFDLSEYEYSVSGNKLSVKKRTTYKDGDIVYSDGCVFIFQKHEHPCRAYSYAWYTGGCVYWLNRLTWNISQIERLATRTERKTLFDALARAGKKWDAGRKQIVDNYEFDESMSLLFGDSQGLSYHLGVYRVALTLAKPIPTTTIKCRVSDLKPGDWVLDSDLSKPLLLLHGERFATVDSSGGIYVCPIVFPDAYVLKIIPLE